MSLEFDPRTGFSQKDDKIGDLLIPHGNHLSASPPHSLASQVEHPVVSNLTAIGLEDLYADWERYSLEYPHGLVMLPGNEVHIVANIDTEYEKNDAANHFGLKCQVVGYEWTDQPSEVSSRCCSTCVYSITPQLNFCFQCLLFLEKELTTLGSMCAASLLNEDTVLPFAGNLTTVGGGGGGGSSGL